MSKLTQFMPGVFVEQHGDIVTVHAEGLSRWWGVFPAALAGAAPFFGAWWVVVLPLIALSVFLFLPRKLTTVFDTRSRRVMRSYRMGEYSRNRTYAFDAIAGLAVKRNVSGEGGVSYQPVLQVAQGTTHSLAGLTSMESACASLVDTVCQATGLARIVLPEHGS